MKFRMKTFEKDRKKCYEMSKSGINLGNLSNTEERISSQRINTAIKGIYGTVDVRELIMETEKCNKKDILLLCKLPIKDRKDRKCQYCEVNI